MHEISKDCFLSKKYSDEKLRTQLTKHKSTGFILLFYEGICLKTSYFLKISNIQTLSLKRSLILK